MKTINLFKEIIVVSKPDFLKAVNSQKKFAIAYNGEIVYEPFPQTLISIFEGSVAPLSTLSTTTSRPIVSMLGDTYRIVEDDDRILIKAAGAWQNIIGYNLYRSLYDDTTADGIAVFSDKQMEECGWHATEFNITYRDIVEQLEQQCEGVLLCIEQEEPYKFSGMGFVFDIEHARKIAFGYCTEAIKEKISNDPDFAVLSDDEEEAAHYFKAL